jgi:hypothetical protein
MLLIGAKTPNCGVLQAPKLLNCGDVASLPAGQLPRLLSSLKSMNVPLPANELPPAQLQQTFNEMHYATWLRLLLDLCTGTAATYSDQILIHPSNTADMPYAL